MANIQSSSLHLGYADCGDWKTLMVGERNGDVESGFFFRVGGAHIDNNDAPVPYEIEWINENKYNGSIFFRGHPRKVCAANTEENLPCE